LGVGGDFSDEGDLHRVFPWENLRKEKKSPLKKKRKKKPKEGGGKKTLETPRKRGNDPCLQRKKRDKKKGVFSDGSRTPFFFERDSRPLWGLKNGKSQRKKGATNTAWKVGERGGTWERGRAKKGKGKKVTTRLMHGKEEKQGFMQHPRVAGEK